MSTTTSNPIVKWEYRLWVYRSDISGDHFVRELNKVGAEGWEMMFRQDYKDGHVFYFKRGLPAP